MNEQIKPLLYTGEKQPSSEEKVQGLEPYIPSPDLVEAVRLTIFLQKRPLLLKGEPGCGKTRLARAVAYELGLPYEPWYIKSTSKARDGFYTYDAISRLNDVQLTRQYENISSKVENPGNYIKFGPLGRAFLNPTRTVVLIDEIDKADIDFPNDLLQELDEGKFRIQETGEDISTNYPPIIFITSNEEKPLPDAFLRRCLFHYVEFPDKNRLNHIVQAHFPSSPTDIVKVAVNRFHELRQKMEEDRGRTAKKVSTSELIDWFTILRKYPEDEIMSKLKGKIPFALALLKSWEDHERYLITLPETSLKEG